MANRNALQAHSIINYLRMNIIAFEIGNSLSSQSSVELVEWAVLSIATKMQGEGVKGTGHDTKY